MTPFHGGSTTSATAAMTAVSLVLTLFFILDSPAAMGNPVVDLSSIEEVVNMAGYGEEKLSTVLIDGTVLCHPCLYAEKVAARDDGLRQPPPPQPISGASVGVFCGGRWRRLWARNTTDEYGEFLIDLPSHLHALPNLHNICRVKILHLPRGSTCSTHPSFKGKGKGIKLTAIRDVGVRTYTAHNIHITPKTCTQR
nr:Non-classical arabinogalactan protein [Ipomoea batatas]